MYLNDLRIFLVHGAHKAITIFRYYKEEVELVYQYSVAKKLLQSWFESFNVLSNRLLKSYNCAHMTRNQIDDLEHSVLGHTWCGWDTL